MFKKSNCLSALNPIINAVFYLCIAGFIITTVYMTYVFFSERLFDWSNMYYFGFILYIIASAIPIFIVIYQLKKVVKTIRDKKPFTFENVKRFNIMGFSMLTFDVLFLIYIAIVRFIMYGFGYTDFRDHVYLFMFDFIPATGSKLAYLISYFVIGCFFVIVGSIFKQAIIIKNENDLTI